MREGLKRLLHDGAFLVRRRNGQTAGAGAAVLPLSAARAPGVAARKPHARLWHRRVMHMMAQGILVFASDGRVLYANPAAERILGQDFTAQPQRAWTTLRANGTRLSLFESPIYRALTALECTADRLVGDIHPRTGALCWLQLRVEPLAALGRKPCALAMFSDQTALRRGEQELRRYRGQMEKLVEVRTAELEQARAGMVELIQGSPIPMCVFADDGSLRFANPVFWETFGYHAEEIPDLSAWWRRAHPDPAYRAEVAQLWLRLQRERADALTRVVAEHQVYCRDGSRRRVEVSAVTLREGYLTTFVDVSERHDSHARERQDTRRVAEASNPVTRAPVDRMAPNGAAREDADALAAAAGFPQIAGHQRALAWQRMDGDLDLFLRSLRLFDTELEKLLVAWPLPLSEATLSSLSYKLHRLKGAAGMVAANMLAEQADRLDRQIGLAIAMQHAAQPGLPALAVQAEALRQACQQQREHLRAFLDRPTLFGTLPNDGPLPTTDPAAPVRCGVSSATLPGEIGRAVRLLLAQLMRRDLAALEHYRRLSLSLGNYLSHGEHRAIGNAMDALAFEQAAEMLRDAFDNEASA